MCCSGTVVVHVRFFHFSPNTRQTSTRAGGVRLGDVDVRRELGGGDHGENPRAKWYGHRRRQQRGPADAAGVPDGCPAAPSVALRRRLRAQQPPQIAISYTSRRAVTTRLLGEIFDLGYLRRTRSLGRRVAARTVLLLAVVCGRWRRLATWASTHALQLIVVRIKRETPCRSWSSVTGAQFWACLISAIIWGVL